MTRLAFDCARVPTVSEKSVKKKFKVRELSGNFDLGQGNRISFLKSGKSQGILSSDFCWQCFLPENFEKYFKVTLWYGRGKRLALAQTLVG